VVLLPGDRKPVDNLKTDQKLLLVPRFAARGAIFFNDRDPMGSIRELFTLRNRIAHPKVGDKPVAQLNSEEFASGKVCGHLVVRRAPSRRWKRTG
jgi:hypothetical protein